MSSKRVTLSIDEKTYDEYIKYCRKNGIILSKQVEFFIKNELAKLKKKRGKDD